MGEPESEERLEGGNMGGAVRVGDTVGRPTGEWTPAVHAWLGHLRANGITQVPRVDGIDELGREVLEYIEGDVPQYPMPDWVE